MLTNDFKEITLSRLGFGTMRLPVIGGNAAEIDEKQVDEMVDYAISHGINYFDTAYPYHGGMSEKVIGRSLSRYPRENYYLATKYPGHQLSSSYDPAAIFEEQLKKCGVDYFDFYLLHNVYENSIQVYTDERWGIVDYFVEQKRKGRIKHLGFSCHGRTDTLREFLDYCGDKMEFCQIQLNYLDWTLQDAKEKYELLTERGLGVWVMEPVPVLAGTFKRQNDPERYVGYGADGGECRNLPAGETADGHRAGLTPGYCGGHEKFHPLYGLPVLLRWLSPGTGYSHADRYI